LTKESFKIQKERGDELERKRHLLSISRLKNEEKGGGKMKKMAIVLAVIFAGLLLAGTVQAGDVTGRFDVKFYGYIKVDAIYME